MKPFGQALIMDMRKQYTRGNVTVWGWDTSSRCTTSGGGAPLCRRWGAPLCRGCGAPLCGWHAAQVTLNIAFFALRMHRKKGRAAAPALADNASNKRLAVAYCAVAIWL